MVLCSLKKAEYFDLGDMILLLEQGVITDVDLKVDCV